MIIHENTLLSEDIFEKHFICDLSKCKGACCIEGEFGAPLLKEEIPIIESELENIKPYLTKKSIEDIGKKGVWEMDIDKEEVTTCLPTGECNFSYRDKEGVLSCGIELAWKEGKSKFRKPISCHLYPIRVSQVGEYLALNYHRWEVCKPACKLGAKHKVAVSWYSELEKIGEALK